MRLYIFETCCLLDFYSVPVTLIGDFYKFTDSILPHNLSDSKLCNLVYKKTLLKSILQACHLNCFTECLGFDQKPRSDLALLLVPAPRARGARSRGGRGGGVGCRPRWGAGQAAGGSFARRDARPSAALPFQSALHTQRIILRRLLASQLHDFLLNAKI